MSVAVGRRAGRLVPQLMKQNRKTLYGQLPEHNEAAALLRNHVPRACSAPRREGRREENAPLFTVVWGIDLWSLLGSSLLQRHALFPLLCPRSCKWHAYLCFMVLSGCASRYLTSLFLLLSPVSNTEMFWFCSEFSLEKSEFRHVNTSRFLSDILQSDLVKYITVYYVFVLWGGQARPGTDFYLGGDGVGGGEGQEMNETLILYPFLDI